MKSYLKNFFSLTLLQVINYLLPLILIPYVIKHIGIEKYGLLNFAQSISIFVMVFFDFGFSLVAVNKIAKNKLFGKRNEIFNSIYIIKIVIFLIIFLILGLLVFNIPKLEKNYITFFLFFLPIFFNLYFLLGFFKV
jgi:PST family polysaccharide transporter